VTTYTNWTASASLAENQYRWNTHGGVPFNEDDDALLSVVWTQQFLYTDAELETRFSTAGGDNLANIDPEFLSTTPGHADYLKIPADSPAVRDGHVAGAYDPGA